MAFSLVHRYAGRRTHYPTAPLGVKECVKERVDDALRRTGVPSGVNSSASESKVLTEGERNPSVDVARLGFDRCSELGPRPGQGIRNKMGRTRETNRLSTCCPVLISVFTLSALLALLIRSCGR